MKRIDNYGAGFLRAGAKSVFAEAIESISYTIKALFTSDRTTDSIFMSHPEASSARDFYFWSTRTSGYRVHSDPPKAGKYWRSLIGVSLKASKWRASALTPTAVLARELTAASLQPPPEARSPRRASAHVWRQEAESRRPARAGARRAGDPHAPATRTRRRPARAGDPHAPATRTRRRQRATDFRSGLVVTTAWLLNARRAVSLPSWPRDDCDARCRGVRGCECPYGNHLTTRAEDARLAPRPSAEPRTPSGHAEAPSPDGRPVGAMGWAAVPPGGRASAGRLD